MRGTAVAAIASGKLANATTFNDTQYEARVPVSNSFAPNITFRCCIPVTVSTVFRTPGLKFRSPAGYPGENGQNPLPAW